jgi:hypothetical protein
MVRLTSVSPQPAGSCRYGHAMSTGAAAMTDSQYAGYRRTARDTRNVLTPRPQLLMQMTKPLIRKNR